MKIFGREPAWWLTFIAALVMAASTFGLNLSDGFQGSVNAVAVAVVGLITAASVHDGMLAALMGFMKALIALGLAFGLHLNPDQQYVIMLLVQIVGTAFVRTQVSPIGAPADASLATPVRVMSGNASRL